MPERIGRYEVVRELGRGATSIVYLARDPQAVDESRRQVALKLMRLGGENAALSRRLLKLFQTEGSIARRLDHPHITRVFDAVMEEVNGEQRTYMVMEYVNGTPLDQFCAIDRLLPMHRVVGIIFKCCLALNLQKDVGKDSTFVMGVGSPAYMSPEQVKGYPLNHKTDLYSLGVVLFQLLTGRTPFRAPTSAALMYKIVNMDTPSVCALNPAIPEAMDGIIRRALEKDLYSRYRNGADFAKDLSTVRYQILDEDDTARDMVRFDRLRQLPFFASFEDVELWEVLRISIWREIAPKVELMREGDEDRRFGIIVSGYAEVSRDGRAICRLGAGEVLGEMAYLHPESPERSASVVTLEPTVFLEVSGPALELASEELIERMRRALMARVVERLREADKILARFGDKAVEGGGARSGGVDYAELDCDLELLPPIE